MQLFTMSECSIENVLPSLVCSFRKMLLLHEFRMLGLLFSLLPLSGERE